jgi:hypothetical protein
VNTFGLYHLRIARLWNRWWRGTSREERVGGRGSETVEDDPANRPLAPRLITADPRKFSHYVLDPANAKGKDQIFVGTLGFRTRSDEDARELVTTYVEQARASVASGRYALGKRDQHGQRVLVVVQLKDVRLRSVWNLRADGVLSLVTPFSGFARSDAEQGGRDG